MSAHHDTDAPRASRRSLAIGTAIVSALLVLLVLAGFEIGFRLLRPGPKVGSLVLSPALGWDRYPPVDPQIHATASAPVPPLRVLCMGDSFTHNTAWTRMLIDELNRRGIAATGWEAGVSGYGQVQEAMKLEQLLPELQPDITVLLFYAWNDPRDNCPSPGIIYNPDMMGRPFAEDDGSMAAPSARWMAVRDSELFRRLVQGWWSRSTLDATHRALLTEGSDAIAAADRRVLGLYSDPLSWMPFYLRSAQDGAFVSRAWLETERAMKRIVELCAAHECELFVAGIDAPFTIDRDVFEAHVLTDPAYRAEDFDLELPLRRFAALARSLGLEPIEVVPALTAFARDRGEKIYDGDPGNLAGHLLRDAQMIMTREMADAIEARASAAAARTSRQEPRSPPRTRPP